MFCADPAIDEADRSGTWIADREDQSVELCASDARLGKLIDFSTGIKFIAVCVKLTISSPMCFVVGSGPLATRHDVFVCLRIDLFT